MTEATGQAGSRHVLRVQNLELVGGARSVDFRPGLNLVRGDITTGKTTLIRLFRGFFGSVPRHLPPETSTVRALSGRAVLGTRAWRIYRPMVTTADTPVEVAAETAQAGEPELAFRLPAAGQGGYGEFVLAQLDLPIVSVPRARREPTNELSPVTINDWLLYCIVTGDELDTQVFGHRDAFRDLKRRWVFEIAYGLYSDEAATLAARLRTIDLEIRASESEAEVIRQFLAGTTFGKTEELEADLVEHRGQLRVLRERAQGLRADAEREPAGEIAAARAIVLSSRKRLDELGAEIRRHEAQLRDLKDLRKQLGALSKRLTRSIVADEWLVDFDFEALPALRAEPRSAPGAEPGLLPLRAGRTDERT